MVLIDSYPMGKTGLLNLSPASISTKRQLGALGQVS